MMQRILALLFLILFSPLVALAALCILFLDGLPLFFVQWRQGQGRRLFRIFKFRTMRDGKPTLPGRILRITGMDELPQLLNIVRGEMAFFGPRPLTEEDVERLGWQGPETDWRWSVLPGLSGLAQLSSVCSARVSLYCDRKYVEKRRFSLDVWILWMTARHILRRTRNKHKQKA